MRAIRAAVSLAAAALGASACATSRTGVADYCSGPAHGDETAELKQATAPDSALAQGRGTLVVTVREGPSTARPLFGAQVMLNDAAGPRAAGTADSTGMVMLSSVPAGKYRLLARRIIFVPLSREVSVRGGFQDTLDLTLRVGQSCLVP